MPTQDQGIPSFGSGRPISKAKPSSRSAEVAARYRADLELQRRLRDDFFNRNPKKEVSSG